MHHAFSPADVEEQARTARQIKAANGFKVSAAVCISCLSPAYGERYTLGFRFIPGAAVGQEIRSDDGSTSLVVAVV
jgi:hypothetical protein